MVSPFLHLDDSESDIEIPKRHVSPTTSTPEIPTAPILPAPSAVVAPSSEFLLHLLMHHPGFVNDELLLSDPRRTFPLDYFIVLILVSTDKSDGSVLCSCMNFARFGFLCRHIFCVLKGNGVEVIPDKYILKRWKRDILPPHIRRKKQMFGFEGGIYMECSTTVYLAVEYCLNLLAKDEGKLIEFVENIKRLKTEVEERNPNAKPLSKIEMFNHVLGVEKPAVNTVNNPEPCSNKGNASGGQRKKSEIEKLREHLKKHRRLCKKCVKYRRHDSRNCTKKPDEMPTYSDSTVVSD
ncbi:FAR1-related sequence 5-like protein [Tanacetum coccineum]|uniref:FAR1-related sequence 5-like protein n=1 Tax=Tanacetum coccineum TaxID=301880 RepID=A0ABQ4YHD2_9ASTR